MKAGVTPAFRSLPDKMIYTAEHGFPRMNERAARHFDLPLVNYVTSTPSDQPMTKPGVATEGAGSFPGYSR
jgi:hypothetical protein